ncbi:ABC transporter substrate-binding protein [Pyrococcus abyssi]|uniref:ABC-type periplasmic dipeptide transport protein n=1 Tax=Pyrococcus abyssi (strain GE5 / Orsay) TaxID=272844 RepID=Q9V0P3_PYRAB|nr:ABC transporter substrate-binding protein [Pyrococcus abyssi]CAB49660.1 ABC-type periplasmic dipeptide transport protein [Pyrococcus abyssi GE5]CCE70142.1 TPA: dipeptide ABC transporter, dipeptide-binding protein [Pyrococcus abyssi GE5]
MNRALLSLLLVGVLVLGTVASGCIGGGTQTQSPTQTASPTQTQTTTQPQGVTKAILELGKVTVVDTGTSIVVVGPKGAEPTVKIPSGKKVIRITYVVDEQKTPSVKKLMEEGQGFGAINPAFFRDTNVDALVIAARRETNPEIRTEIFKALYILGNYYVPEVILGQNRQLRVYWSWVKGRYYHPTLAERYDLLWEDKNAPVVPTGVGDYNNDPETYVIATFGWPESFDPAWTYETFGWEIWHEIGDTLVTYWKENTKEVSPDLAVAWAHNKEGTEWYFVIRGGVKAYDPWHDKTYPIDATDVLFTFWRVARLGHSVSWMVKTFMNVSASQALTEEEFNEYLKSHPLVAEYHGKTTEVKSLQELLDFFGYKGETAGVFKLVLPHPYAAILNVVADPFLSVVPMEYLLGDKYEEALKASNYGKNPDAWKDYVQKGANDATHQLMHKYPVGTGPFYVKDYQENSYIVLEYNPYYWNATDNPGHKRVIYIINSDAVARVQLLTTGTADVAAIPTDKIEDVKGVTKDNYEIIVKTDILLPVLTFIVFNTQKEPFNDVKVRQALAYAIPYDQIAKVVYNNLLEPNWGPIPKPWPGYTEYGIIKYNYNIAKAKQMLQEAGIDPSKYSIKLIYNAGNSQREKIMTLIQNIWSQLGFKVTVESYEWPVYLSKTEKGDYDVYVVGWVPDYLDSDNWVGPFLYGATEFKEINIETS